MYTGVTRDLYGRVTQHCSGGGGVFTRKYNVNQLVYFEVHENIEAAIEGENQIKAGSRQKKLDLIDGVKPEWNDLYLDMCM